MENLEKTVSKYEGGANYSFGPQEDNEILVINGSEITPSRSEFGWAVGYFSRYDPKDENADGHGHVFVAGCHVPANANQRKDFYEKGHYPSDAIEHIEYIIKSAEEKE